MSGNAEASEPTGGASFLLDTNVLIDVLKGEPQALAWLEAEGTGAAISVITWMEILVGCHEQELEAVTDWLNGFTRLELTQPVASKAVELRRTLGIKIPDAIILATARCHQRQLVSRNTRDFPVTLGDVVVPYQL
jgi:hypothetical protein